jgi:uncharacterized protein with HEPN domain
MGKNEVIAILTTHQDQLREFGAARNLPPDVEELYPEIPWVDVRGMRNVVIHEYFQVLCITRIFLNKIRLDRGSRNRGD